MKTKCYLSIDFEDFSHDFKRDRCIDIDGTLREDALWKAYEAIETFCQNKLNGARLTFFCTGVIAKKFPNIIARISGDGHEIACHYFYHDFVYKDSIVDFENNLVKAIDYLEKASGQKVMGFRAPFFSIRQTDVTHFKVLEKLFLYDSSLTVSGMDQIDHFRAVSGISKLALLPVTSRKIYSCVPAIKTGGTFLKFFSANAIIRVLTKGIKEGIVPLVYLHPYEFLTDGSFSVDMSEMRGMKLIERMKWGLRQYQWHVIGNKSVDKKLSLIFEKFEIGGCMKNLLFPIEDLNPENVAR